MPFKSIIYKNKWDLRPRPIGRASTWPLCHRCRSDIEKKHDYAAWKKNTGFCSIKCDLYGRRRRFSVYCVSNCVDSNFQTVKAYVACMSSAKLANLVRQYLFLRLSLSYCFCNLNTSGGLPYLAKLSKFDNESLNRIIVYMYLDSQSVNMKLICSRGM